MDDAESGYGTDPQAQDDDLTSIRSTILDYQFENGRRYHRYHDGQYNFPNDDREQERENLKHTMLVELCDGKIHWAPIGNDPQEILDLGTGTGAWAIEMGDLCPSAHVMGVDLSPIQPVFVPPNVEWLIDDIESDWIRSENYYDYIHSRHIIMAIRDWDELLLRSWKHLKPGGWVELQEIVYMPVSDHQMIEYTHPLANFFLIINAGLHHLGVTDVMGVKSLPDKLQAAGFVNITVRPERAVPLGSWPKDPKLRRVGTYWQEILRDGVQAIAMGPLTRGLGWSKEEVEVFLIEARKLLEDNEVLNASRLRMSFNVVYAQKP